jgi:hypothetical protein
MAHLVLLIRTESTSAHMEETLSSWVTQKRKFSDKDNQCYHKQLKTTMKDKLTQSILLHSLILFLASMTIDGWRLHVSAAIPKVGSYYAGSRIITVVRKGNRYCYEGVSIPHKRYAVAVGETIGSLSPYRNGLIIDGLKRHGLQLVLSQGQNSLLVTLGKQEPQVYQLFDSFNPNEISNSLKKCLSSRSTFYMAVPGSGYKIR